MAGRPSPDSMGGRLERLAQAAQFDGGGSQLPTPSSLSPVSPAIPTFPSQRLFSVGETLAPSTRKGSRYSRPAVLRSGSSSARGGRLRTLLVAGTWARAGDRRLLPFLHSAVSFGPLRHGSNSLHSPGGR